MSRVSMSGPGTSTPGNPTELSAICVLSGTEDNAGPVSGSFVFQQLDDDTLNVTVSVSGLSDGEHGFHVHTYGDVSSATGAAAGGHFKGDCDNCRPGWPASLQEVGLLDNGTALTSVGGRASMWFVEGVAKLSGVNSILGRSMIIHGNNGSSSVRVAECVIGWRTANLSVVEARPAVSQATCWLEATSVASNQSLSGLVTFTAKVDEPKGACGACVTRCVSVSHCLHLHLHRHHSYQARG